MSRSKAVPVFAGVRPQDLRIRFIRLGHKRAFFARWRPQIRLWECQLSGYGLKAFTYFCSSQFVLLSELRCRSSVAPELGWRWDWKDDKTNWDGISDPASPDYQTFAENLLASVRFRTAPVRSKGGFTSAESNGTANFPSERYPHRVAAPMGARSVVGNEGQGAGT